MAGDRTPRYTFAFDFKGQLAEQLGGQWVHRREQLGPELAQGGAFYSGRDSADVLAGFDAFCLGAYDLARVLPGRKVLLVDELQNYVGTHASALPPSLALVIKEGRHFDLAFGFTCQTLNEIHNAIRAQLTTVCAFRHQGERATQFLESIGFDARDLLSLDRGQYLEKRLDPPGPILACDDVRGIRTPLPGQSPQVSPHLARIFGKGSKPTR
jgi:hypothetical protein